MSHPIGFETFTTAPSAVNNTKYDLPPSYCEVTMKPGSIEQSFLTDLCDEVKPFAKCLCLTCTVGLSTLIIVSILGVLYFTKGFMIVT